MLSNLEGVFRIKGDINDRHFQSVDDGDEDNRSDSGSGDCSPEWSQDPIPGWSSWHAENQLSSRGRKICGVTTYFRHGRCRKMWHGMTGRVMDGVGPI